MARLSLSVLPVAVLIMSIVSGTAFAQSLPPADRCVSQDLRMVGATVTNATCITCTPGTQITSTLTVSIRNNTQSLRTAYAFFGTLVVIGSDGQVKSSTPISGCNDQGFPGGETKSFPVQSITYTCGDQLKITGIYGAWTDASDGARNMCPLDPSKIAPKCGTQDEIIIDTPLFARATGTNVNCYGQNTGSATVTVTGGTGPYTYSWSPSGGTGATASNLAAGTYSVTVRDAKGCATTASYTVTQPTALVAGGVAGNPIACYGGTTTLTASATGGTSPYQYSINGTNYQSSPTFTVGAGSYTIYVKDANQCVDTHGPITINQPTAVVAGHSAGTIACYGGTTTLTASATGGTAPYQYSINGGTTWQPTPTFTVSAGTYTIRVKDANNCTDASEPITINQPPALIAGGTAGTVSCNGGTTTLTATATGGTAPYQYSINGTTYQNSPTFTVTAGTYTVTVKDANNCTDASEPITITQPTAVSVNLSYTAYCVGIVSTVRITAVASGGTGPYTYVFTRPNNTTFADADGIVEVTAQGAYQVRVTDSRGCIVTKPITPTFIECNPCPPVPCVNRTQTQGGWGATPHGNNPASYLYANFTRAFPNGVKVGDVSTTDNCTGYSLTLTSAQAVTDFLPSGSTPRPLDRNYTNPGGTYNNNFAGQVVALTISVGLDNAIASFGASDVPLQDMVITTGVFEGKTVAFVLSEANRVLAGCSSVYSLAQLHDAVTRINESFVDGRQSGTYLICPPRTLTVTFNPFPDVCVGSPAFTLTGGSPAGGIYYVNNVASTTFNPTTVGTFTVRYVYTNQYGCTGQAIRTITVRPNPVVTLAPFAGVCAGSPAFTLTGGLPIGGTYYVNGMAATMFNPTTPGIYTIRYVYTSPYRCTGEATRTIEVYRNPMVQLSYVTSCVGTTRTAKITAVASGGSGSGYTYTFTRPDGTTFADADGIIDVMVAGTYSVRVTDSRGCVGTASLTIVLPPCPPLQGCTPGYWKNHPEAWGCGYVPTGASATRFFTVFNNITNPRGISSTITMYSALDLGGGGYEALVRHATAALLNACHNGVNYPYTREQIIVAVRSMFNTGTATLNGVTYTSVEALKNEFDRANNLGCPLNNSNAVPITERSPAGGELLMNGSGTELSAYPNPYTDKATIEFSLKEGGDYTLVLHDVKGSVVKRISAGKAEAGKKYSFEIGNNNMPEGIYFARLTTDKFNKVLRISLRR